jgi:hypothetical protein
VRTALVPPGQHKHPTIPILNEWPPAGHHRRTAAPGRRAAKGLLLPGRQDYLGAAARHRQAGLADLVIASVQLLAKVIAVKAGHQRAVSAQTRNLGRKRSRTSR